MKDATASALTSGVGRLRASARPGPRYVVLLGVVSILGLAACGSTSPTPPPASLGSPGVPSSSGASAASLAPPASSFPTSPSSPSSPQPAGSDGPGSSGTAGPLASGGSIAVLGNDGSLSIVGADRRTTRLASAAGGTFQFPAWSPDGSRIAAIRNGPKGTEIVVFTVAAGRLAAARAKPVVIFRSPTISPFYLDWTPDSRNVSFLANGITDLQLRLAPADGTAPLDGSGAGAVIRTGSPFYFDWIGPDRLLAHVGIGTDALLGEIGLNGKRVAPGLRAPGLFNAPVVSADGRYVAYVRADALDGSYDSATYASHIVVAARDGSSEHTMPEFGVAAVEFDPAGDMVASIGATTAATSRLAIPIGPLRVMDAQSGAIRTLLDGFVMGFWWSPDGRTIGALRIEPLSGSTAAASLTSFEQAASTANAARPGSRPAEASATPAPSPAPEASGTPEQNPAPDSSPPPSPGGQQLGFRLVLVDVASGQVTSEATVQPGLLFGDQVLPYFDQYAASHHLWAPDSSSILVPVTDPAGVTRIRVMFRNGDPPATIDGAVAFWSP